MASRYDSLECEWKTDIYSALAEHQKHEDWEPRHQAATLLSWATRMNLEFKLRITELALRFEKLPVSVYSQFRSGHNGFGLRGEITFNLRHLKNRGLAHLLLDLNHELVHAWQHEHGRPDSRGRHNREYRKMALQCGLHVTEKGETSIAADGVFQELLQQCGVGVPNAAAPSVSSARPRVAGTSKLAKWICSCPRPVNVRVAVPEFQAMCLICNHRFRNAEGGTVDGDTSRL